MCFIGQSKYQKIFALALHIKLADVKHFISLWLNEA